MTLAWAARIALALWIAYDVAVYAEHAEIRRSPALRVVGAVASVAITAALVWAGWWS